MDLNLDKIKKDHSKKYLQSELKINIHDRKDVKNDQNVAEMFRYPEGVEVMNFSKQIKTTKNSNENSSQREDLKHADDEQTIGLNIDTIPNSNEENYNHEREYN